MIYRHPSLRYNANVQRWISTSRESAQLRCNAQVFASLKDIVGAPTALLDVPEGCSVQRLLEVFAVAYPRVATGIGSIRVAVNDEYATAETVIQEDDRIALLPPVSGGCGV